MGSSCTACCAGLWERLNKHGLGHGHELHLIDQRAVWLRHRLHCHPCDLFPVVGADACGEFSTLHRLIQDDERHGGVGIQVSGLSQDALDRLVALIDSLGSRALTLLPERLIDVLDAVREESAERPLMPMVHVQVRPPRASQDAAGQVHSV